MPRPTTTSTPIPTAQQREMRAIAGDGWRHELEKGLEGLESCFLDWRAGRIDAFELTQAIHAFHDGTGRVLYRAYAAAGPALAAARAVHLGLVAEDAVSDDLRRRLGPLLRRFQDHDARRPSEH